MMATKNNNNDNNNNAAITCILNDSVKQVCSYR